MKDAKKLQDAGKYDPVDFGGIKKDPNKIHFYAAKEKKMGVFGEIAKSK